MYTAMTHSRENVRKAWQTSFEKIAPFWPLKTLIAVNPLQGFEDKPFQEALCDASAYFQSQDIPEDMAAVNRQTIKWLQVLLDEGQATLRFTQPDLGLYENWRRLVIHDKTLHHGDSGARNLLKTLPQRSEDALTFALERLDISPRDMTSFLTLLLTTLPGWASAIKYRGAHIQSNEALLMDYLSMRLLILLLVWPDAKSLLSWKRAQKKPDLSHLVTSLEKSEDDFQRRLIPQLLPPKSVSTKAPQAQFVFCIDVRSEPFRRFLEAQGPYETYGFAGFFGIPARVVNTLTKESFDACPVLLKPKHCVKESPLTCDAQTKASRILERADVFKKLYQSLKYNFTTPLCLVESLGSLSGAWMALKTFAPKKAMGLKSLFHGGDMDQFSVTPILDDISFDEQCAYGASALQLIGLTKNFSPLVVLCGHKAQTQNNAFASGLDCGACGGNGGTSSARILATILNKEDVRRALKDQGIDIPLGTHFVPATHNTTTDEVTIDPPYADLVPDHIMKDLTNAGHLNAQRRLALLGDMHPKKEERVLARSLDWAQVRPEWGLAGNAAFIVGPRALTKDMDLEGRCFLHSYDASQDPEGTMLGTILSAPMVVAQWINAQYLFSTFDNASYGAGSKITKNITGKHGVMQGNASDLMTGLPLQSVYKDDKTPFHTPQRLLTVVFATRAQCLKAISNHEAVQRLVQNAWVHLVCIENEEARTFAYGLQKDLTWRKLP